MAYYLQMRAIRCERKAQEGGGQRRDLIAWQWTVCRGFTELMVWDLTGNNSVVRYSISWPEGPSGTTRTGELDMDLDICITESLKIVKSISPYSSGNEGWKDSAAEHFLPPKKSSGRMCRRVVLPAVKRRITFSENGREMERAWLSANKLWYVTEAVSSICWEKEEGKITLGRVGGLCAFRSSSPAGILV